MSSIRKRLGALLLAAASTSTMAAGPPANSPLDAQLFYQLLIGEIELRSGQAGNAYEVMLDAARRTKEDALFRRAIEIALSARAGDQALAAARAWRTAQPNAVAPLGYIVQLLVALNRPAELAEPLKLWLAAMPAAERPGQIAALPRLFSRNTERTQLLPIVETALQPYLDEPETRTPARVALGRMALAAGDTARALELAKRAHEADSTAEGPALLALEMLPGTPAAEAVVLGYLGTQPQQQAIRMVYARVLSGAQRYADALVQLQTVTRMQPDLATAWLSMGALQLELRQPADADVTLRRYLDIAATQPNDEDDDSDPATPSSGVTQALLMLAQAAEQRGDWVAAEQWLSRVDNPRRALDVQVRRASLMARQGQTTEALELIRAVPERAPEDARAKLVAEAQVLRDVKRFQDAYDVLDGASKRFTDDADLLYEQAMLAEKLDRMPVMEQLLRKVIELKPDFHHAYNALGYSLADRNQRLPEARDLIKKALELSPGEPFITDSLGWVEYRLGNRDEALRLLREAYNARPDVEIAAHLGEVLWVIGQHEEARRIWRDARGRDASNEVLLETLARLRVDL
jgi:tetratricopeptide (TPR) repeat protein